MLMQPTLDKLYSMKLTGMVEAIRRQMEDPEASRLSFEERLALLVDQQWDWRQNKALERRLKSARFKTAAAIEDIDYRHPRRLDRQLIRSLSACDWVRHHQNVIVTGPCGVGKSFIAGALAQKAVREGFTSLYVRAPRLFRDLAVARADGSFGTLLDRIARIDVFLLQRLGLVAQALNGAVQVIRITVAADQAHPFREDRAVLRPVLLDEPRDVVA